MTIALDTTHSEKSLTNKDAPRYRMFEYESGGAYKIECRDPYGFWYITSMKGPCPDELAGTYTSLYTAEKALEGYIGRRDADGKRRTQRPDDNGPART